MVQPPTDCERGACTGAANALLHCTQQGQGAAPLGALPPLARSGQLLDHIGSCAPSQQPEMWLDAGCAPLSQARGRPFKHARAAAKAWDRARMRKPAHLGAGRGAYAALCMGRHMQTKATKRRSNGRRRCVNVPGGRAAPPLLPSGAPLNIRVGRNPVLSSVRYTRCPCAHNAGAHEGVGGVRVPRPCLWGTPAF